MLRRLKFVSFISFKKFLIACLKNRPPAKRCRLNDKKCIVNTLNVIAKSFYKVTGKELPIQTFHALIPGLEGLGLVKLKFSNPEYTGVEQTKITKATGFRRDPDQNTINVQFKLPTASVSGRYVSEAPIYLTGYGSIVVNDMEISLVITTAKEFKNNSVYMKATDVKFSYTLNKATFHFTNDELNYNPLVDVVNGHLNYHALTILEQMEESMHSTLAEFYKEFANLILLEKPYDEFFEL